MKQEYLNEIKGAIEDVRIFNQQRMRIAELEAKVAGLEAKLGMTEVKLTVAEQEAAYLRAGAKATDLNDRLSAVENQLRELTTEKPKPVITAVMVHALAAKADTSFLVAKDALTACNGDQAAAEEWIRTRNRWPR